MSAEKGLQISYQNNDSKGCRDSFIATFWENKMKLSVPYVREDYQDFQFNAIYKNYYSIDEFDKGIRTFYKKSDHEIFTRLENVKFGTNAVQEDIYRFAVVEDYVKFHGYHLLKVEKYNKSDTRHKALVIDKYQLIHLPDMGKYLDEKHWSKLGDLTFLSYNHLPDYYKKYRFIARKEHGSNRGLLMEFEVTSVEVVSLASTM